MKGTVLDSWSNSLDKQGKNPTWMELIDNRHTINQVRFCQKVTGYRKR
jgi:hypothetical protein